MANVVYRRHYTGCVDNGMASWVLVDDAGNSSTVFKTLNGQLQEVWSMMGDNAGYPAFCAATIGPSVKHQQQMFACAECRSVCVRGACFFSTGQLCNVMIF